MHILVGVSLLSLLSAGPVGSVATGPINPDESDAVHEWPAVKQGVWSIEGTLVSKGKRKKKWKATTKRCDDATTLFQGYWGRGKADKDSCLFQSTKLSSSKFQVIGECLVEQNQVVKSETTVTTKGKNAFQMEVKFQEGKVAAKAKETAHWVSACSDAETTAAKAAAAEATANAKTQPPAADKTTADNKTPAPAAPAEATADH
jgi:hypothetical protein